MGMGYCLVELPFGTDEDTMLSCIDSPLEPNPPNLNHLCHIYGRPKARGLLWDTFAVSGVCAHSRSGMRQRLSPAENELE